MEFFSMIKPRPPGRWATVLACLAASVSFGFLLATSLPAATAQESSLAIYPAPGGMDLNETFGVEVRSPGGTWRKLDIYDVRVDLHTLSHASFAYFDFSGTVEVRVTHNKVAVQQAEIRPLSCQIHSLIQSNAWFAFTLDRPRNLSIEVNGDRMHNLHLFANPLEKEPPSASDPNVIYFGPGLHTTNSTLRVGSGKTLYIAGGAVVQGTVEVENEATNVTIRGRGILDMTPWNEPKGCYVKGHTRQGSMITLRRTSHSLVEGIILKQPTGFAISGQSASDITIDNIKAFSSHEWGDGIDMAASKRIQIRNSFLRMSDDCIAVYGSRGGGHGSASDWEVSDSTFWADKAHAIFIGMHGDYNGNGDVLENLRFRNIDILECDEISSKFWGALAIACGDKNTVRNVLFQDIRVEHISEGRGYLIHMDFDFYKPSTTPGRRIENITFKNVSYKGNEGSVIEANLGGSISGVTFDNLSINGRRINNAKEGKLAIGENVTGVVFVPAAD